MGSLQALSMSRNGRSASSTALRAWWIGGEKGGVGKSVIAEALSILLEDAGTAHTIAECEGDARLGKRLGERVIHHPLHADDAQRLAEDPDLLNAYWDRICAQVQRGPTVVDLAANALKLALPWAATRSARAALAEGVGMDVAVVTTADSGALSTSLDAMRRVAAVLPKARRWLIVNPMHGAIALDHPGIARLLAEAKGARPIVMPVCRSPDWGVLKNLGRFDATAALPEEALERHGIPALRAGRSLDSMQDWVLAACDALRPLIAAHEAGA